MLHSIYKVSSALRKEEFVKKQLITLLMVSSCLLLTACGENIFSENDPPVTADNASTQEEFQQLSSSSQRIINSDSTSNTEKKNAATDLGFAEMGAAGFTTLDIAADISDLSDADSAGEEANTLDALEISASSENIRSASDGFLVAAAYAAIESNSLSSQGLSTQASLTVGNLADVQASINAIITQCASDIENGTMLVNGPTYIRLSDDPLFALGTTTLISAVKNIQFYLDIASDGTVTVRNDKQAWHALYHVFLKDTLPFSSIEVNTLDFVNIGLCALNVWGALASDQLVDVEAAQQAMSLLSELRAHVIAGTTFSHNGQRYTLSRAYSGSETMLSSDDSTLLSAIEDIINDLNQ